MNPEEEKANIISEDFTGDGVDTEAGRQKKNLKEESSDLSVATDRPWRAVDGSAGLQILRDSLFLLSQVPNSALVSVRD